MVCFDLIFNSLTFFMFLRFRLPSPCHPAHVQEGSLIRRVIFELVNDFVKFFGPLMLNLMMLMRLGFLHYFSLWRLILMEGLI